MKDNLEEADLRYKAAKSLIQLHQARSRFFGECQNKDIRAAEDILECEFTGTYEQFLKEFGAGSFAGEEFYGLKNGDRLHGIPDVVWATQEERELGLPQALVLIYNDGFGGLYCLDYRDRSEQELPISYCFGGDGEYEIKKVFDSFGTFFLERIETAITAI